ncbi:MAG: hypothetical protein HOB34_14450 [Nitrospina sp.]|nr:hypothetical protein [Nitrospina sp.]
MLNLKSFSQRFLLTLSVAIFISLLFSSTALSQEKHCSKDCQKKEFKYMPKILFGNMAIFGSFGYTDIAKASGLAGTSLPAASITGTETQAIGYGWFKKPILLQILDLDNEDSIKAGKGTKLFDFLLAPIQLDASIQYGKALQTTSNSNTITKNVANQTSYSVSLKYAVPTKTIFRGYKIFDGLFK